MAEPCWVVRATLASCETAQGSDSHAVGRADRTFPGRCAEDRTMSVPRSAPAAPAGRGWLAARHRASRPASCRTGQRPSRLTASHHVGQAGHAMAESRATGRCCERAMGELAVQAGRAGPPCRPAASRHAEPLGEPPRRVPGGAPAPAGRGPSRAGGPHRGHELVPPWRVVHPRRRAGWGRLAGPRRRPPRPSR